MLSAVLGAGLLLAQPEAAPRYRKVLANGIRVVVERTSDPARASVVMAVSRARVPSTPETHGWLHLLEHLSALGANRDLDQRLEIQGMTLTASNTRDAILYEVRCSPDQAILALRALREIATEFRATQEDISREAKILEEEMALESPTAPLAKKAWSLVFGQEGLDSMGSLEAIRKATPEDMASLHRRVFTGRSMAISLAGDFEASSTGLRAEEVFATIPPGEAFEAPIRSAAFTPQTVPADGIGSARASLSEGLDTSAGLAILGAALVISRGSPDITLTYSPSLWRGLIVLTGEKRTSFTEWDRMERSRREASQAAIRQLVKSYLLSEKSSPSRLARFHAQVGLQNPTLTVDRLLSLVEAITPEQAGDAMESFSSGKAVAVEGSRTEAPR